MPFFKKTQDQSVCMSENNDDSKAELIHWQCFCVYRRAQEVLTLICGSTGCHHWSLLAGPAGSRYGGEDRRRGEERSGARTDRRVVRGRRVSRKKNRETVETI